jgi:hypothetical protein
LYKTQEYSPLNSDKTLTKKYYRRINIFVRNFIRNKAQKLYTNYRAKRMVILRGKRKNLTTPLSILGQNVGEKIKYIYPGKKDGYI